MRVAFQPKGPRPLFQAVSADHFPPFLFEFDPHGHKLGPKIDFMPEIDPIHYSGDIYGEFCPLLEKRGFSMSPVINHKATCLSAIYFRY